MPPTFYPTVTENYTNTESNTGAAVPSKTCDPRDPAKPNSTVPLPAISAWLKLDRVGHTTAIGRVGNIERGPNINYFFMSMPLPACSPFAADPPNYSTLPATQRPMRRISEGSQVEHTMSSPTASTEANSENAVDSPTTRQFAGGHVAHASGLRPFNLDPNLIPSVHGRPRYKSTLDLLIELDSPAGVGLTMGDVVGLLSRCDCGRVMTKRSFLSHRCSTIEVIDLTLDD